MNNEVDYIYAFKWALFLGVIFFAILFILSGCMGMESKQISTYESLWLEDPKSGDLLWCEKKDLPTCYLPKKIDGNAK